MQDNKNLELKSIHVQWPPEVARRRKILRSTFLHASKSHSAAPGMYIRVQRARIAWKNARGYVCFAAVYCIFFRGGQANPIQTS